ncbi:recombinase family protein [Actinosynnema sp. NPDC051121]
MTADRPLAYGYLRVGGGPVAAVAAQREELRTGAVALGLLFDTVFIDLSAEPAMARPGLRALLDVVRAFRPYAVLVPSAWHLSNWPDERAQLLARFRRLGSHLIAVRQGRAVTLVAGAGRASRHG